MKQTIFTILCCLVLQLGSNVWGASKDYHDWNLEVVFYNASKNYSEAEIATKVADWVQKAEQVYQRRPSLKIHYRIERLTSKGGRNLDQLIFDSDRDYNQFMEQNFDNVAVTKTEGWLVVLISDKACAGTKKDGTADCWGGKAFFPHFTVPFSSKRGISMVSDKGVTTLAHELGHMLSLKHTFEPYVGLNLQCNKEFKPKGNPEGFCNSCPPGKIIYDADGWPDLCNGLSNIMDYCGSTTGREEITTCQEQRAANQRLTYMTSDGKTDYFKLKGLKGEPICKEDSDCEDGRYCDTGTLSVGHNQCKVLKALDDSCTREGQCASGRCNAGKCKVADECQTDTDCGANAVCRKGPLGLGQNQCFALTTPTCPSGWQYETRNPLNKDQCLRTTTKTAKLECKLLITDNAKNWTGPHAQAGSDECRSSKGKQPKGVKCPSGFTHIISSGADSCSKQDTEDQTPSCPAGWNYKSRSGKDECEET